MSLSICTYCGTQLIPGEEITLAGTVTDADGDPMNFDTEACLLAWLRANGHAQAADDYAHALWVLDDGIDGFPEGFPPKADE